MTQHTHISHNSSSRAAAASGVGPDAGGGVVSAPFLEAAELGLGRNRRIEDSVRVGLHDAHRDRPRVVAHERHRPVPLVRRTVEARARLAPEAAYLSRRGWRKAATDVLVEEDVLRRMRSIR